MPMTFSDILIESQDRKARGRDIQRGYRLDELALQERQQGNRLREYEALQKDRQYQQEIATRTLTGLRAAPPEQRGALRDQLLSQLGPSIDPQGVQLLQNDEVVGNDQALDAMLTALGADTSQFQEKFSSGASAAMVGGQPGMVQIGSRGTVRQVPGLEPIQRPGQQINITNMPEGAIPPTKPMVNKLQEQLVDIDRALGRTTEIASNFNPQWLQMFGDQGQIEQGIAALRDKSGIEFADIDTAQREALKNKTKFVNQIEQLFNAYRKEITGAAAAVQELERLKKSFLNADQSPAEFEASLESYMDDLKRSRRLLNKIMREGFTDFSSPEGGGGRRLDTAFLSGDDDDANLRAAELRSEGYPDDQIAQQLIAEGYRLE